MKRFLFFNLLFISLGFSLLLESTSIPIQANQDVSVCFPNSQASYLNGSLNSFDFILSSVNKQSKCEKPYPELEDDEVEETRVVYWKVTEHGYTRCRINCLLEQSINEQRLVRDTQFDFMLSHLEDSDRLRLSATFKARSNEDASVDSSHQGLNGAFSSIFCAPFVDVSEYDHLEAMKNRDSLKAKPEPSILQTYFSRNDINLVALYKNLLDMSSHKTADASMYKNNANFFRVIGNAKQALECYRKALNLEPSNPKVLLNFAQFLANLEAYGDAISVTRALLEQAETPDDIFLLNKMIAEVLQSIGLFDEALQHYKNAQNAKPNSLDAQIQQVEEVIDQLGPEFTQSPAYIQLRDKYFQSKCMKQPSYNIKSFYQLAWELNIKNMWLHMLVVLLIISASNFLSSKSGIGYSKIRTLFADSEKSKKHKLKSRPVGQKKVSFDESIWTMQGAKHLDPKRYYMPKKRS